MPNENDLESTVPMPSNSDYGLWTLQDTEYSATTTNSTTSTVSLPLNWVPITEEGVGRIYMYRGYQQGTLKIPEPEPTHNEHGEIAP